MATRAEVEAARKKQLKDGKKQKDLEKGRAINDRKVGKMKQKAKGY